MIFKTKRYLRFLRELLNVNKNVLSHDSNHNYFYKNMQDYTLALHQVKTFL